MTSTLDDRSPSPTLDLAGFGLTSLPGRLPTNVQNLNISNNRLGSLPGRWPMELLTLHVNENPLAISLRELPLGLEALHVGNNQLRGSRESPRAGLTIDLVMEVFESGQRLNFQELTPAPEDGSPDRLGVESRALSVLSADASAVSSRLSESIAATTARYRAITAGSSRVGADVKRLEQEISKWSKEAGWQRSINLGLSESEPNFENFFWFLVKLRNTKEYEINASRFGARVCALLDQIQGDPQLRGVCFNLAEEAVQSCGDRVALRMLEMEAFCMDGRVIAGINAGGYDKDPQAVVDYCKAVHRQQVIDSAATEKIRKLYRGDQSNVDEIQVILNLRVAFSHEFKLPAKMCSLVFPGCEKVTPKELAEVRKKLTNLSFTEETKELYKPYFFTNGQVDGLTALPRYESSLAEAQEATRAWHESLASSPVLGSLLARMYEVPSKEMIDAKVAERKNDLHAELSVLGGMSDGSADYLRRCEALKQKFNGVYKTVVAEHMQPVVERLRQEHKVEADLL